MELLLNVLQGSYAYLLVFQILVVTGLVLFLIWLVAKRTQEANSVAISAQPQTEGQTVAQVVVASDPDVEQKMGELQAKLDALADENKTLKASQSDSQALKEKVKFLESKLLEYEILQEEIGALSGLKIENEKLKKELLQKDSVPKPTATPKPVALEQKTPNAPAMAPESNPPPASSAELTGVMPTTPASGAFVFDTPPGQAPSAEAIEEGEKAAKGLENLLAQIDDLGGPPGKI